MENIKPGGIIKGSYWPEPVEIKLIEETGDYIHLVGATTISRDYAMSKGNRKKVPKRELCLVRQRLPLLVSQIIREMTEEIHLLPLKRSHPLLLIKTKEEIYLRLKVPKGKVAEE